MFISLTTAKCFKKTSSFCFSKVSWHLSAGELPKHKSLSPFSPPTAQLIDQVGVKIFGEIGVARRNTELLPVINSYGSKLAMQHCPKS